VSKRHIIGYEPSGAPIRRDVVAQTSPKGRPIPFIGGGAPGPDEQRLTVIDARLVEIASELEAIEALPEPEGEDAQRSQALSDRATLSDELIAEAEELNTERAPYATRIARRAAVLGQARELAGAGGPSVTERGDAGGANDHSVQVRTGLRTTSGRIADPYRELDAVRSMRIDAREMVHRARTAIEDGPDYMLDEHKEQADLIVRRASKRQKPLMAQHMLLTGSEPYREMFENYMYSPMDFAQRAALSLTNANGGYLVPFTLDPTVILTNTGSANPYRQISAVKRTATNNWNGVASTGMNAAWLAEAGVVADNSPTFSNIQITPQKAAAWVFGSYEILEDSDFETELPGLLADAKDRLEEAAFATGLGSGSGQPKGIITAATTLVTGADTTTHTIAIGDVYAVQAALPARFRRNASWVASISAINRFRQLDTAGGSSYWTNLGQGQPERLLGGGIFESTTVAAYTGAAAGQLIAVYGDFNQFAIVDRIGMSVMYEPMVKDPTTARPTGQGGWFAFWRVGSDALVPGAFRVMKTG
jgi:HK97 family phage major capsid protein